MHFLLGLQHNQILDISRSATTHKIFSSSARTITIKYTLGH
jgi:hypothetical protein